MHPVDIAIVVAYLLGITALGIFCGRRSGASSQRYFLAGRSLRWPTIGLALFATNISTVHLIGLASSGYKDGMVVGNFEWLAAPCLILLGLVFAPFYFRSGIATLPEFLERRYGPGARTFLAFMAVVGALFIHIGVTLYAGAVVLQSFLSIPIVASIAIVSALTALYTVTGGLKAVVVTESIQTVLLLVGALAVTIYGLEALNEAGIHSLSALRERARPEQLAMIRSEGGFAWYAMLLGYPVIGVWYWCSDQTIVQRVLGARTERDAQLGPIFAGCLKILPVLVMVFPGVIAYALFRDRIGAEPDRALAVLIQELVPSGLRGVILAGLLAALMSTVAGALNSTATLVSLDIVKRLRPETSERSLVRTGRLTAIAVMLAAMAWSSQGENFGGIFEGINHMIACLAPPITTVFLLGVFWKRGSATAALLTLIAGFTLGVTVFVLDYGWSLVSVDLGIPFMLQAWWLFVSSCAIFIVSSLLTEAPDPRQLARSCGENPLGAILGKPLTGPTDPRLLSLALVVVLITLYAFLA